MGVRINGISPGGFAYQGQNLAGLALTGQVLWKPFSICQSADFLTLTCDTDFSLSINGATAWDGAMSWSIDGDTWSSWGGGAISSQNRQLYLRGVGNTIFSGANSCGFVVTGGENLQVLGNVETLLDWETAASGGHPTMGAHCFHGLFTGCETLITAPTLPATELNTGCYQNMFMGCTALAVAPALPATVMKMYCYHSMFSGCTALVSPPALPGTTLAFYCYTNFLNGCSSLSIADSQSSSHPYPWAIPSAGTIAAASPAWNMGMLTGTAGPFVGTTAINTTYYCSAPVG